MTAWERRVLAAARKYREAVEAVLMPQERLNEIPWSEELRARHSALMRVACAPEPKRRSRR